MAKMGQYIILYDFRLENHQKGSLWVNLSVCHSNCQARQTMFEEQINTSNISAVPGHSQLLPPTYLGVLTMAVQAAYVTNQLTMGPT